MCWATAKTWHCHRAQLPDTCRLEAGLRVSYVASCILHAMQSGLDWTFRCAVFANERASAPRGCGAVATQRGLQPPAPASGHTAPLRPPHPGWQWRSSSSCTQTPAHQAHILSLGAGIAASIRWVEAVQWRLHLQASGRQLQHSRCHSARDCPALCWHDHLGSKRQQGLIQA